MIEIKDLLVRFGEILLGEEVKKEIIIHTLQKVANVQVEKKDIEIKKNTVYLNIKPIYKNQIFLRESEIKEELASALGKKAPDRLS